MSSVKKSDRLGWGVFYVLGEESAPSGSKEDQLIVCFLTINRQVVYLRVLQQPPGGFYPVVIAPPNVRRIKVDFGATRVCTEDFAHEQIKSIVLDANRQIEKEKRVVARANSPRDFMQSLDNQRSKLCTVL